MRDVADGRARRAPSVVAALAAVAAVALVGTFFLGPYLVRGFFGYPVGWDSPFYVWRAGAVGVDGLDRIGTVRPASPLLFAMLMSATGLDRFAVAALAPALFAGVAGAAAAAIARAATGMRAAWVPLVALVAWVAFGNAGMVREQPDNVLNAAFGLAAIAAAAGVAAGARGRVAAGALFAAAGLAHWPFFGFLLAAYVAGVALFLARGRPAPGGAAGRSLARPLLAPAAASAAVVGLSFLWRPPEAWTAPKLGELRDVLRARFLRRAADPLRWAAVPLAGIGTVAVLRLRTTERPASRRLVLAIFAAWVALTAAGALAQLAGLPVAGLRLLNYLFPLTLLAAIALWWLAGVAPARGRWRGWTAALVVATSVGGFTALTWSGQVDARIWYEEDAVAQASAAGTYVQRDAPGARVAFPIVPPDDPLTAERWRNTVLAQLPPEVAARSTVVQASRAHPASGTAFADVVVALQRYNRPAYRRAALSDAEDAMRFAVLRGPAPSAIVTQPLVPQDRKLELVFGVLVGLGLLFLAGGGWAIGLLPRDPVVRPAVAPALGAAAIVFAAAIWDRAGLPLHGTLPLVPAALAAAAGWLIALRTPGRGVQGG